MPVKRYALQTQSLSKQVPLLLTQRCAVNAMISKAQGVSPSAQSQKPLFVSFQESDKKATHFKCVAFIF